MPGPRPGSGTGIYPRVGYRYLVAGVEYHGKRVVFGSGTRSTLRELDVGEAIDVYYDPDDPETAVLQPWISSGWEFWVIFGLVFSAAAAVTLMRQIRKSRASYGGVEP